MYICKRHIAQLINKIISGLLCFFLILVSFCPITAMAAETEQKTVRVGYYVNDHFQEGTSEDDVKSGYGYEYLRKVANYSGWKYEYVYGKWADLYEQFLAGEIDIMAGVSQLKEREDYILFPDYEMGIESYYLYKHEEDTEIVGKDPSTLSSKKIGVIKNTTMEDSLRNWMSEHPVDAEIIEFDGFEAEQMSFDRKEIDVFVEMDFNISTGSGRAAVVKVGELPYYLAVTKGRPDLLAELNAALAKLNEVEPYFRQNLQYSNYGNSLISHMLSETEQEWVREHDVMNVGYFEAYIPYCGSDQEGNATGLLTDVMTEILRKLRIEDRVAIRYASYHSYEKMVADLHTGKLDVAFPVGGELWNAEQDGIYSSSPVVSAGVDLTFVGSYDDETVDSIAVNKNNKMQYYYTVSNFPDAKIVFCNTVNDCLDAVLHGKAGSTILNGIRTNSLLSDSKYSTMVSLQLSRTDDFCFGAVDGNDDLLLLLNRGIKLIGEDYGINASHKYMTYQYTTADFVRENALFIVLLTLFISAVIIFLLVREAKNRKRYTAEIEKSRNELADALKTVEEASHAKSAFLFNMSHDIRTPMNAIIGFTNIALKQELKPEVRECLEKIGESSEHLLTLINDVLDISRIESGKMKYNPKPIDITAITDTVLDITRGFLSGRDLDFRVHRVKPESLYVLADAVRIREVLVNILSNAVKFTDDGGSITFETGYLAKDDDRHIVVRYRISDTGIGMSAEFLEHIFDEFSQENSSARTQYKGTGLGMAITKQYVDLMGGTISVDSKKGKGSTFIVELPLELTDESKIQKREYNVGSNDLTGVKVLMAEDNDLNAEIATIQLEDLGIKVTRATDGREVVRAFSENSPGTFDVILMDMMMPEMNGYEATAAIRGLSNRPDALHIPIIAMTANAFAEDIQASLDAGMNGHLSKPIVMDEVVKTIARNLDRYE